MLNATKKILGAALLTVLGFTALSTVTPANAALPYSVSLRNYFGTMTFTRPVQVVAYPDVDSQFVVIQQNGRLITVRGIGGTWVKVDSAVIPVLNGTGTGGNEQGLLGFTFHPNFRVNRKYYAYYIANGGSNGFDQIVERVMDVQIRPRTSDSQRTVLRMVDPYENHNSGTIRFGADGFLYFAIGDGGSGGDPQNRAQNLDSLFGKVLRLDVDGADAYPSDTTKNYAVPADNPFIGQAPKRPEIWAYGLRNPYRWNFHPTTGDMWVGDVGQEYQEEVSRVTKGANMGWKIREGNSCYNGQPLTACSGTGMTGAVITVARSKGQSLTGGEFFLGNPASAFHGVYFFGDYASDSLWAARITADSTVERIRIGSLNAVASFDRDKQGRILASSVLNGTVSVLESPDMQLAPVSLRPAHRLGIKAISMADLRLHPEAYTVTTLDGRTIAAGVRFNSAVLVRRKSSAEPAQLFPWLD